jgi:hypothetical protein
MGLGMGLLVSAFLLAGLNAWIERLRKEAVQFPPGGEFEKQSSKGVIATVVGQIRGPKDVLAGIGFGIILIIAGGWGVLEGHKYELINAPDSLIFIASIFNLIVGSIFLWRGIKSGKILFERWLRKKL